MTFFDNDFAGRIAQKQMQAARAVTDVATEMINTVAFALASIIGSVIYLIAIDAWIALALAVWLAAYVGLIIFFLIMEPEGLNRLWQNIRNYFRVWPFSY